MIRWFQTAVICFITAAGDSYSEEATVKSNKYISGRCNQGISVNTRLLSLQAMLMLMSTKELSFCMRSMWCQSP